MITVVTPAYNAEKSIEKTIQSVINQTYTDWKMIVVDDCSKDNTCEIVQKFADIDERIILIKHKKNGGVAAARNTALKAAKGDYIAFLDSDDLFLPEKLERQLTFMQENDYALTYTKYQYIDEEDKLGKEITVPNEMSYTDIFKNTAIACLTVMVNRKKVGEFYMPPLNHTEDQCTWQEILSRGYKAYGLCEVLSLYRVSANSMTGNKLKVIKRQWYTYRGYHKLSLMKSAYYFMCYAYNAVMKRKGK